MIGKKIALIITVICLAAAITLALLLALGNGGAPKSGSARFVSCPAVSTFQALEISNCSKI